MTPTPLNKGNPSYKLVVATLILLNNSLLNFLRFNELKAFNSESAPKLAVMNALT